MNTERKLYDHLAQTSGYDAWTDEQLREILTISREGAVSPAKLRLVQDELKANKDALDQVMIERDDLARRLTAQEEDNAILNVNLEATITALNETTPKLIAAGEAAGGTD